MFASSWGESVEVTSSDHANSGGIEVEASSPYSAAERDAPATKGGRFGFTGLTKVKTYGKNKPHGDGSTANETSSQDTTDLKKQKHSRTDPADRRMYLLRACAALTFLAALGVAIALIVSSSKKKKNTCVPGQVADVNPYRLEVSLVGLSRFATDEERTAIESTVQESYNEVSGGCEDEYERFMYQSTLTEQVVSTTDDGAPSVVAVIETAISCDNCPPSESFASEYPSRRRLEASRDRLVRGGSDASGRDLQKKLKSISFAEVINVIEANLQFASSAEKIEPGFQQLSDITLSTAEDEEEEVVVAFMMESAAKAASGKGKGSKKSGYGCNDGKGSKSGKSSKSSKSASESSGSSKSTKKSKTASPSSSSMPSSSMAPSCSSQPSEQPSVSMQPTMSQQPSVSQHPTLSGQPSGQPSVSMEPTLGPTLSAHPSQQPSNTPSTTPSSTPSVSAEPT